MTYPIRRRNKIGSSSRTFLPSIRISPEVGSIKRLTMRSSVVLPEPEVPTSIQVVPSGKAKLTASTAGLLAPGYCFVMLWNAIFAMFILLHETKYAWISFAYYTRYFSWLERLFLPEYPP